MDIGFEQVYTHPEHEIFRVVFFPDRIYHNRYLSAARSSRYRYNVTEVRSGADIVVMKGDVYLSGARLCSLLRLEYSGRRLVEVARQFGRRLGPRTRAWIRVLSDDGTSAEATVRLHYDPQISAYSVEIWETLEPPAGSSHDHRVSIDMGRDAPIVHLPDFDHALSDLSSLRSVLVAFSEDSVRNPTGQVVDNPQWENAYQRTHEEPRDPSPNSSANTVVDLNYLLDFQRGFFIPDASQVPPVNYVNAMSDTDNPDRSDDNLIQMRWLFQREFGSDVVFFHEVTVPPGAVEGTHRHVGSEELYYVVSGTGLAYMSDGDDPNNDAYPLVTRPIFGLDPQPCRELPVKPGSVIFTKSGGCHGIRNPGQQPLKFVAFLYHTS